MTRPTLAIGYNTCHYAWMMRRSLIEALGAAGYDVAVIAPRDRYASLLEELGVTVVDLPMRMNRNPVTDLLLLARFRRALARLRPVAYLGYTAKPNIYGSLAARSLGIPAVNNIAGLGAGFMSDSALARLMARLYRVALSSSAMVFFQNPDDAALFRTTGVVRHDRTEVLPGSGVDLDRFGLLKLPARDGGPFRFLFVGRMLRDKGLGELVEAVGLLRARGRDLELRCLGTADVDNPAVIPADTLRRWQEDGILSHEGFVEDIRPALSLVHAVVLPSYREGTPRVLLEAAASGRPVVTADSIGCREAVIDGETGLLCRPRDAEDLARAMARLMDMTDEGLSAMGEKGRAYMERRYDERIVIERYLAVLARLAGPTP